MPPLVTQGPNPVYLTQASRPGATQHSQSAATHLLLASFVGAGDFKERRYAITAFASESLKRYSGMGGVAGLPSFFIPVVRNLNA